MYLSPLICLPSQANFFYFRSNYLSNSEFKTIGISYYYIFRVAQEVHSLIILYNQQTQRPNRSRTSSVGVTMVLVFFSYLLEGSGIVCLT